MPLNAIDYSKTIIYKIQHKEKPELFYIGHTTNYETRKSQHKKASSVKYGSPFYKLIQEFGGWKNFLMSPIKQISCENRIEALIEEQRAIDEYGATLNYNHAHKATAQYKLQVYRKEYDKRDDARDAKLIPFKRVNACNYFINKHMEQQIINKYK